MGYSSADTLPEALQLLGEGNVRIVAGGTDFFPMLGDRQAPPKVLDVSFLAELRGIRQAESGPEAGWTIGATTTWTEIANADLPPAFDGLKDAARQVGSIQIQNAGTIAGNLCNASPAADGVAPLLTLGATVELRALGRVRHVALSDFITGVRRIDLRPDELVYAIHIPPLPASATGRFLKLGSRKYLVISIAMVSVLVSLDDAGRIEMARVAVGSCSGVATRLGALEGALIGLTAGDLAGQPDIWTRHLDPLSPIGDVRGSAEYRQEAAAELCKRAVLGVMEQTKEAKNG